MLTALEANLNRLRRELVAAAGHLTGGRVLTARPYRVGPITALALTRLRRGSAGLLRRKPVRFAGLDVTVHSSDGKRSPGHLSRQGAAVLRWGLYEAGKAARRAGLCFARVPLVARTSFVVP